MAEAYGQQWLRQAFAGRRVLITGHTGFKGGWLALWLHHLGAKVTGIALEPEPDTPSFFSAVRLGGLIDHRVADLRNEEELRAAARDVDAEFLFHLAAQPLVRRSYEIPAETLLVNVVGTARILDIARSMPSLRAAIVVTSDKCYENVEDRIWGYRETDRMGGADPYSASKGCAELVVASYRRSYFSSPTGPSLASARAGNVIGGGDWSADRLIPDLITAAIARKPVLVRNPTSTRPWQHVLEPLAGYLLLASRILDEGQVFAGGWNFGPNREGVVSVADLADEVRRCWDGTLHVCCGSAGAGPHEAGALALDNNKARLLLGWEPQLTLAEAVASTVDWYRAHAGGADMRQVALRQIEDFVHKSRKPLVPAIQTSEAA